MTKLIRRKAILGPAIIASFAIAGLMFGEFSHDEAYSQQEAKFGQTNTTKSGIPPRYPVVPDSSQKTNEQLSGILSSVSAHDAHVEIVVGQPRLLTLNKDLAAAGKPSPVVAVGDPTVLELEVLPNPRLIRLLGRRAGVTEVSITTSDAESYSIEVAVVYDLPIVDGRLQKLVGLVTPYLVEGMNQEEVGPLPGDEVCEPNDSEFLWKGETEGTESHFRSTTSRSHSPGWSAVLKVEERCVKGLYGYSH